MEEFFLLVKLCSYRVFSLIKSYTEDDLGAALEAIASGAGIREATRHWGIPKTTLLRRLAGAQSHSDAAIWQMRLSSTQESNLTKFALNQSALGMPLTHFEMRAFAARLTSPQPQPPPLGKKWLRGFLARNPGISNCRSRQMHYSRVNGAKTEIIKPWFNLLRLPAVLNIKPENRHNADEGGIAEGTGSNGIVLGPKARKFVVRKSNGGKGWTSFMECISATGKACPPLVIFKGKSVQQQWFKTLEGHEDWEFTATDNGWTNNAVALEWLQKIFIPWTKPTDQKEWRLLVVDGHKSHCTFEFMWECFSNKVYVVYLPPHTSHVLQPLDLGVFASLKAAYKAEADLLNFYTENTISGKQIFLHCYRLGRTKALKKSNLLGGWRASGLWPVNMAKPLLSVQLLEMEKKKAENDKSDSPTRKRKVELVTPVPISIRKVGLSTPKQSREVRCLHSYFDSGQHSTATQRLLFRKVEKAYDEKDWQLNIALREVELLKAKLEQLAPVKRKKVETSPNSRFVQIKDIRKAQIEAGVIEAESADEEDSEVSETLNDCIVVAESSAEEDDEVGG